MKNKVIGIILILISICIIIIKNINEYNNTLYQNKIISKIKDSHNINSEYIGYIEIPKYKVKRLIKEGTNNNILDHYFVGKMNIKNNNLTILAGHDINLVFHKLHYLNKDDIIYLNDFKYLKIYKVIKKIKVDINDYTYLYKTYNKDTLLLITCTNKSDKRLIVILEKTG